VFRGINGDHDRGHAGPQLIERESVVAADGACRRGGAGGDMVIEASVLVVGDDEHAGLPVRRAANGLVGLLNQPLARGDAPGGVLGVASREVRADGVG
jgi:hypothetical protein